MRIVRWVAALVGVVVGLGALAGCGGVPDDAFTDSRVRALVAAAGEGDLDGVRELVGSGVDLETRGRFGRTPLLWLVATGDRTGVRTLLAAGADPGIGGDRGDTAIHVAAGLATTGMIDLLVEHGVDVSTRNTRDGSSALDNALMAERPGAVTRLIELGIDVTITDTFGNTAVHTAAKINQGDAILQLLAAGADPRAVNAQGVTFQRYLYMTPARVRSAEFQSQIDAIEADLTRRGVPLERPA